MNGVFLRFGRFSPAIAVLAMVFAGSRPAAATTFVCASGDVACLVTSIHLANQTPATDTIVLAAGVYTLSFPDNTSAEGPNGLPVITSPIVIQGAGQFATTIARSNANNTPEFRILEVAANGLLNLDSLEITRGSINQFVVNSAGGAGILNLGHALLTRVAVDQNFEGALGGGGIESFNDLSVFGSFVGNNGTAANGGGILSSGSMSVTRSSIRSNFAHLGGGVATGPIPSSITGCDVTSNHADGGGGVFASGDLTLTATTISQNSTSSSGDAGGGTLSTNCTLSLENCTVSDNVAFSGGNGGGIRNAGSIVNLRSTILARNTHFLAGNVQVPEDCSGTVTSLGHNAVGVTTDCTIALQATDLTGDPGLGAFTDQVAPADGVAVGNGQVPLLAGSPAIDRGDPAACGPIDQLAFPRADGDLSGSATCDMGAVEFEPVVTTLLALTSEQTVRDRKPLRGFPAGRDIITRVYTNTSREQITRPVFVVKTLTNGNMLLNSDPPAPGGVGARLTPNVGPDLIWSSNESVTVTFVIGLVTANDYKFGVDAIGYPQ